MPGNRSKGHGTQRDCYPLRSEHTVMELVIREAQEKDLPALTELYNYYIENTAITFDLKPNSVEERREWYQHYNQNNRHRLFVAVSGGKVLGYSSSGTFNQKAAFETSVETTVYLHPEQTGNKIGTRLYNHLFIELAKVDVHRAYAGITWPNPGSFAFHAKFDFKEAAVFKEVGRKFGVYHDVHWLEKELNN